MSRREKIGLIICGVMLSLLLLKYFVTPVFRNWREATKQLEWQEAKLKKCEAILQKRESYAQGIEELEKSCKNLLNRFYVSKTPLLATSELLRDIERIASSNKLDVSSKSPLGSKKIGKYHKISVSLILRGNSAQLANFLYSVGTAEKLLHIPYLNISSPEAEDDLRVALVVMGFCQTK